MINFEVLEISVLLVEGILEQLSITEVGCKIDAVNFIHAFSKEAEKEKDTTIYFPFAPCTY